MSNQWPPVFTQADLEAAVRDAVAHERVQSERDIHRVQVALGEAMRAADEWQQIAQERRLAAAHCQAALHVASEPLPSWLPGREAVARLTRITRILQENQ